MMRVAVAGLWHETNTFSSVPADYAAFDADVLVREEALWEEYLGSEATIAGFLDAAEDLGFELVPLLHARTGPIGTITDDAFERIVGEILERLDAGGPWDAVLLANHGAAVAQSHPDADGEMAARVRSQLPPNVPIGMALDLHANVSHRMVSNTTVLNTYQTNPHLDARSRGREVAELTVRAARGEIRPVQALVTPPLVINITRQWTGESPMRELIRVAEESYRSAGVLSVSAVQGYPYADVPEMGMSFHAVSDADPALAQHTAHRLAQHAWNHREQMRPALPSPEEALREALTLSRNASAPIVIMDVGDNILGGSSADSTVLLAAARQLRVQGVLQTLFDPAAVAQCAAAGEGARMNFAVGAKTDEHHGSPLPISGRVLKIADGRYEDPTPTHGGFRYFDDGKRALIETDDGATVLLTSNRSSNLSREQWYSLGVKPEQFPVIVAKGVVSPRPAYEPIAAKIILANTPGLTTADLDTLRYRRRRRPLFPFEPEASYAHG